MTGETEPGFPKPRVQRQRRPRWLGLRRRSRKQEQLEREVREVLRPQLLERSGGHCEARFSTRCTGVGVEVHHVVQRSAHRQNDPADTLLVCRWCHQAIDDNPEQARARGLLRAPRPAGIGAQSPIGPLR